MTKETRQLIQALPYNMQDRVRGYLDYVNAVLYQILLDEDVFDRQAEVESEIELICLIKFLYAYFVTGYRNFDNTLTYMEDRGIVAFSIGSSNFQRQGYLTQDWKVIVSELENIAKNIDALYIIQSQGNRINAYSYITNYGSVPEIVSQIVKARLK